MSRLQWKARLQRSGRTSSSFKQMSTDLRDWLILTTSKHQFLSFLSLSSERVNYNNSLEWHSSRIVPFTQQQNKGTRSSIEFKAAKSAIYINKRMSPRCKRMDYLSLYRHNGQNKEMICYKPVSYTHLLYLLQST